MDSSVQAAIVGAVGGVIGVVVKSFTPELKGLLLGKAKTNSDLVGTWECIWSLAQKTGEDKETEIQDRVKISRVRGEELWATGINTKYGDYKLTGRVSRSSLVTFHYEGVDQRQPLGGVVILKLNATRNEMTGRWYEYGKEEKIVGGRTVWKKTL